MAYNNAIASIASSLVWHHLRNVSSYNGSTAFRSTTLFAIKSFIFYSSALAVHCVQMPLTHRVWFWVKGGGVGWWVGGGWNFTGQNIIRFLFYEQFDARQFNLNLLVHFKWSFYEQIDTKKLNLNMLVHFKWSIIFIIVLFFTPPFKCKV